MSSGRVLAMLVAQAIFSAQGVRVRMDRALDVDIPRVGSSAGDDMIQVEIRTTDDQEMTLVVPSTSRRTSYAIKRMIFAAVVSVWV